MNEERRSRLQREASNGVYFLMPVRVLFDMRLGRENLIIVGGIALIALPFIGVPDRYKLFAAALIGAAIALLGLSVRYRVIILKRKVSALPPHDKKENH